MFFTFFKLFKWYQIAQRITDGFINLLRIKARLISLSVFRIFYICILLAFIHSLWLYLVIFNRSGDIEKNPWPKHNSCQSFSICHWNLNNIPAHIFLELSHLPAYITVHTNQSLNQMTVVLTNSCQLRIKSTNLLMTVMKFVCVLRHVQSFGMVQVSYFQIKEKWHIRQPFK